MTGTRDPGPVAAMLADGRRLHLQHGPIDLVLLAEGRTDDVRTAYRQAHARFRTVLSELVGELPRLRQCVRRTTAFRGTVARRMQAATVPLSDRFITPMASVAGAVADEILASMRRGNDLERAFVNNGGDIALHLTAGTSFRAAIVSEPKSGRCAGQATITATDGLGGIATSGRHGRSLSLGIADAVTVLARDAAAADAAATLVANAVDLPGSPKVVRRPAVELDPDSDLGERRVTVEMATLTRNEALSALAAGERYARELLRNGHIGAAFLSLCGLDRIVGSEPESGHIRRLEHA